MTLDQKLDWLIRNSKAGRVTDAQCRKWLDDHEDEIGPGTLERISGWVAGLAPSHTLAAKYGSPVVSEVSPEATLEVGSIGVEIGNEATLEERIARLNRMESEPKSSEVIRPPLRGQVAGRPSWETGESRNGGDPAARAPLEW
jgi:hypothetical protein